MREPASTQPVGTHTLPNDRPHFHPLWARHRLMYNFLVPLRFGVHEFSFVSKN